MVDKLLMTLGFVGAVGDGLSTPTFFMFTRIIFNDMSKGSIEAVNERLILSISYGMSNTSTGTSTEVVTSITNDNLVIQDCLSEKVPNFIMNDATFIDCYGVGFFIMWRLALVASPTVMLLITLNIMYGHILMESFKRCEGFSEYRFYSLFSEYAVRSLYFGQNEFSILLFLFFP
ncbi:hypothetical protein ZIOFF_070389 [Zingiber officinale]|uniref:ABC transmembrane type-1 domain-containing protein n=1 Tax=Zingiber officinale TaxID=94328 RepID=A0A8J5EUG8_ZINOF|nr:hypothetical protein ZIOFF_070389 [Zingiber officinale]